MRTCKNFPLGMSAIYPERRTDAGGLQATRQFHSMADQELAGAVKRAPVSNPKRDRISTAVRAENSFPTPGGTGQKGKERLSGDEPMRLDCHHQRLSTQSRSKHHQYRRFADSAALTRRRNAECTQ